MVQLAKEPLEIVVDEGSVVSLQPEQIDIKESKSVEEMIGKASLK